MPPSRPAPRVIRPAMMLPLSALLGFVLGTMMWADWSAVIRFDIGETGSASGRVSGPTTSVATVTGLPRPSVGVRLPDDLYGRPADDVVVELRSLGLAHREWPVCSGSVAAGEVRQIVDDDEEILVDKGGVSTAGRSLTPGERVTVLVGTGERCNVEE